MFKITTITLILLLAISALSHFSCTRSVSTPESNNMEQAVYTLGVWHVLDGNQQEFITTWKEIGTIFASLPEPPGKGVLIQSTSDPTLFYSFGPWSSMEAIEAMRNNHQAKEGIQRLIDLCSEATPGAFHVVAESPY